MGGRTLARVVGSLAATIMVGGTAAAAPHHEERWQARDDIRVQVVRNDSWHFVRGRGWRFEHRPGVWSPYHLSGWVDGRVVLRPAPVVTVVRYANGHYMLRGDGVTVPYQWVWVATAPVVAVPPAPIEAPPFAGPPAPPMAGPPPGAVPPSPSQPGPPPAPGPWAPPGMSAPPPPPSPPSG